MSLVSWDGLPAMPRPKRARGRTLSDAEARRLRDILAWILKDGLGLPRNDVIHIMGLGIQKTQLYDRRKGCPLSVRELVDGLRKEPHGARLGRVSAD